MSIIIVVKKQGRAVIAADTLTKSGSIKVGASYNVGSDKIVRAGDTYIGLVGSSAHGNAFESVIKKHGRSMSFDGVSDIYETYLKLHPILKEEFFLNPREGDSDPYESSQIDALVANRHGIFGMFSWREVFEYERFWAIGSGREIALGALHAVYDRLETAEEIAEAALTASCEFDDGSGLPFTSYSISLGGHKKAQGRRPTRK
ncbi:MAG: ATP-dependent HslUV protease, peptidase subunit HslV [Acidobacteriota bacterium]|jgi:ATP-dependent protease HslVU (ClpYQ) peptidase subunit|nr:ATP-dependent HslUV protease, peptidase subunit HslV [Acidobacteriota bacterium]